MAAATAGLREVRLYGHLRQQFGRSHWLAVDSPAEALRALCVLFKGFRQAVLGHRGTGGKEQLYRVLVGDGDRVHARDADSLDLKAGSAGLIRIAPVIHGRKRGGLLQVVIGAALLIAAPYAAAALFSAMGGVAGGALAATAANLTVAGLSAVGKAMILGGIIQLVSPQRQQSGRSAKDDSSYTFGSASNMTEPGGPVPLIIGRMIVTSTEVSSGISTDEYTPSGTTLPPSPPRPGNEMDSIYDDYYNQGA